MSDDPREAAARYRFARDAPTTGEETDAPARAAAAASVDHAAVVETALQQAMRRGDFDDLPGAGKPLEGLGATHDPDWWIRRKIQREQLRGLGPPALMLRVEHAEMPTRLAALRSEAEVREALEDFNRRVIEARRQLLGGPPVVTPTLDVEAEVAGWLGRASEGDARDSADAVPQPDRRPWWRRRPGAASERG